MPPKRILVVDDDNAILRLLLALFSRENYEVDTAVGGKEALAKIARTLYDVIVLDLMMPDVNGFDVVAALSARADTARIPIMVVTAKQITAADRHQLNGSVATIMEKTEFSSVRFAAEVRRAMSGRRVGA